MEQGWVKVYITGQLYQAEIARELLENNNIQSVVLNQNDSVYKTFGDIEIYVNEAHELAAIEILKELKH